MKTSNVWMGRSGLLIGYVVWIALFLCAGWALSLFHALLLDLSFALRFNQWVAQAVRQLSLPILGLIWLVFIFWLEHYLRIGVHANQLWTRAGKIVAVLAVIVALIFGARWIL